MRIFMVLLVLVSSMSYAAEARKNIVVLIEPSAYTNDKVALANKIAKEKAILKARKVYVYVLGRGEPGFITGNKITRKKTLSEIKKVKNKKYSLAEQFTEFTSFLEREKLKGKETLLVLLGDFVTFRADGTSSLGYYLNDAWLESQYSPFVRDFISNDLSGLDELKLVVIGQQNISALNNKKHEHFIGKLFRKANKSIQFMGYFNSKNQFNSSQTNLGYQIVKYSIKNNTDLTVPPLQNADLFQFVRSDGTSINLSASEVRDL